MLGYYFEFTKIPKVFPKSTVTVEQIKEALELSGKDLRFGDSFYDGFDVKDILKTIQLHRFADTPYLARRTDCEDFSFSLMAHMKKLMPGICFGMVWGDELNFRNTVVGKHSINFFIGSDGVLRFIEPQNNEYYTRKFKPYFAIL